MGLRWLPVLVAAFAGLLWLELVMPLAEDDRLPVGPPPATSITGDQPPATGKDQLSAWTARIEARPLFAPSRRPPATDARPHEAATAMPRLSAVIISQSEALAIFADASGAKPIVVRLGGEIGGHVLRSIAPGQVTVAGADGTHKLRPDFDRTPPAVPVIETKVAAVTPRLPVAGSQQTLIDRVLNRQ